MKKLLVIAALLAIAVPASALTTLDFEGLPTTYNYWVDHQNIGSYYPGVTLGPDAVILTAPGYMYLWYPPHSGNSVFRPYASSYVDFTFDGTVNYFEGWFTYGGSSQLYMEGYDAADNLIASASMGYNLNTSSRMSISAAGIKRVRIHDSTDYWSGDDIAFEPCGDQVIPEPTSIMLGALGLGSIVGIRRFRKS